MQLKTVVFIVVICIAFCKAADITTDPISVFSQRNVFLQPLLSYSLRDGYIDLPDAQKSLAVTRSPFFSYGLCGGMQFPLTKILRLQLGIVLDAGFAGDDTLFTAETALVQHDYFHGALEPQLHLCLWQTQNVDVYTALGCGFNVMWVHEQTFFLHNPSQEILYTDRNYENNVSCSFHALLGIGCDYRINKKFAASIGYSFRYLYPVSYDITDDFPLTAMQYKETLFGNIFYIGLSMRI